MINQTIKLFEDQGIQLRPGQLESFKNSVSAIHEGKTPLSILPTGYGKTLAFAMLSKYVKLTTGKNTVVFAGTQLLVDQNSEKLSHWLPSLKVQGHHSRSTSRLRKGLDILVTTPLSYSRGNLDNIGLVVMDEAHHGVCPTWENAHDLVLEDFDAAMSAYTATPMRTDKQSLGKFANTVATNISLGEAARDGYLILPDIYQELINEGDAVTMIKVVYEVMMRHGGKVLCFCQNIRHAVQSQRLMEKYCADLSVYVHCEMDPADRREAEQKFAAGGPARICFQVDTMGEGYDNPEIRSIGILRNMQSGLTINQSSGRCTRPLTPPKNKTARGRRNEIKRSAKPTAGVFWFRQDGLDFDAEYNVEEVLREWHELAVGESREAVVKKPKREVYFKDQLDEMTHEFYVRGYLTGEIYDKGTRTTMSFADIKDAHDRQMLLNLVESRQAMGATEINFDALGDIVVWSKEQREAGFSEDEIQAAIRRGIQ